MRNYKPALGNAGNRGITACPLNTAVCTLKDYTSLLSLADNYAALVELYKPDGVVPNRWTVDSHYDNNLIISKIAELNISIAIIINF